jgi:hypothetical protein
MENKTGNYKGTKSMNEEKEFAELKDQIGQLLFDLQTSLSETDRQNCLLLLEKTLRKYYDLKQTADEHR